MINSNFDHKEEVSITRLGGQSGWVFTNQISTGGLIWMSIRNFHPDDTRISDESGMTLKLTKIVEISEFF